MVTVYIVKSEEMGWYPVQIEYIGLDKNEALKIQLNIEKDCNIWMEEKQFYRIHQAYNYIKENNPYYVVPKTTVLANGNKYHWKEF